MDWLKMSPEYRVHTAVGNDGYEGPVPWMKTRQEILAENAKKMKDLMRKMKADNARFRHKKLEHQLRQERLKGQLNLIQGMIENQRNKL